MSFKKKWCEFCEYASTAPVVGGIFKSSDKVAVIRLSGIITDQSSRRGQTISYAKYDHLIEQAFDLHRVRAVALVINSPGGSPAQSSLIGQHIRNLAEEKDIPVYAFVEDVAASGGYWLACAADEIYAQDSSILGSIGVIASMFGFQELIARYGIERRLYTSGKEKSMLDPFQDEKPADVKRLKALQSDIHDLFKDWVRERRGDKLKGDDKSLFEGQIWTAAPAIENGIIDGVAEIKSFCKKTFGDDIKLKEFGLDKGLIASLLSGDAKLSFTSGLADDFIGALQEKMIWSRYGL